VSQRFGLRLKKIKKLTRKEATQMPVVIAIVIGTLIAALFEFGSIIMDDFKDRPLPVIITLVIILGGITLLKKFFGRK
jgi:predicted permease